MKMTRFLIPVLALALGYLSPVAASHDVDYEKYRKKAQELAVRAAKDHPRAVVVSRICSSVKIDESDEEEFSAHEMCLDVVDFPVWIAEAVGAGKLSGDDLVSLVRAIRHEAEPDTSMKTTGIVTGPLNPLVWSND